MKTLVFLIEEPSAKEMLDGLLMRLLPANVQIKYVIFQGKQDLEKNLERRLRGWLLPDSTFIVMMDQDAEECHAVKERLVKICQRVAQNEFLVRIACHELESFYLGDLAAVEAGLDVKGLSARQNKRKFRNPDHLANPSVELKKLTRGTYQKVAGSRSIGPHLSLTGNRSKSFNVLLTGIRGLLI